MSKAPPKKPASSGTKPVNIQLVAENRKARFDYTISDTMEAGFELRGSEVKAMRTHGIQLKDSYVIIKKGEIWLQGAHIAPYQASSYMNHEPERQRKLLLSAHEIERLIRSIDEKGFSCVPLKVYFKGRWAKVEIALVKGKKAADKRESIKSKDVERELQRARAKR